MNIAHVFYIRHTQKITDVIFEKLLMQLPEFFQKDIRAYKHRESAQASLLGKILLQYGLQQLALNYSLADIKMTEKDRPYLEGVIDFNISHSGEYVMCAIGQLPQVGIDIEKHRILKMNIADRYFTQEECNYIDNAADTLNTFFDLWTVKESAIKCDGRGVEVLSRTVTIDILEEGLKPAGLVCCDGKIFYFQQIKIADGYSSSICSAVPFEIAIYPLQLLDFGKYI